MLKKFFLPVLFVAIALSSCNKGDKAKESTNEGDAMTIKTGSTVSMDYTLKVDGNVFDSSSGKEPLVFVYGNGQIIPGLEEQMVGMKKGDKKSVTVSPDKGYGESDPTSIHKAPKTAFTEPDKMKVGDVVTGNAQGQPFQAIVKEIGQIDITLDLNHPLAGKTLNFDIEIVDVK